jgi:hypothetical protein
VTEQYLIAHKVRGEPALDIAEKMIVDGEEWWIIPTSGHRAYPYWSWEMAATQLDGGSLTLLEMVPPMPPDLPEHYEVTAAKGKGSGTGGRDLLTMLGLVKPVEPMTRRGW